MQLTRQIKLIPTPYQKKLLEQTMAEYISLVNAIVDYADSQGEAPYFSSKSVHADLPSCLRAQCCLDARSIYKAFLKRQRDCDYWNNRNADKEPKTTMLSVLRKPVAIWNNQNYKILADHVEFPMFVNGKSKRISIKCIMPQSFYQEFCSSKLGTLRITYKGHKPVAQISLSKDELPNYAGQSMGIDLGIKVPAVCRTEDGKTKFIGNGRKNKTMRRYFQAKRKKLGKLKKFTAIKHLKDKEQCIMRDIDHKLSRQIINYAKDNHVSTIKLETLANIRKAARKSRKNNRTLSNWSFYRLASYIEYKAKLAGIQVVYVRPEFTSQICPVCGKKNHATDRSYICDCGFHAHRDLVGAINILHADIA